MRITIIISTATTILQILQSSGALAESIVIETSIGNLPYLAIFPGSYGILRVCFGSEIHLASFIYLKHTHNYQSGIFSTILFLLEYVYMLYL